LLHRKCRCGTYETGIFCLNNPVFDHPLTLCNPIYYTFYLRSSNFSVVSYMICFLWPYNMELTALRPEFLRIGLLHQGTFDYIKSGTFDYISERGWCQCMCYIIPPHCAGCSRFNDYLQDVLGDVKHMERRL